MAIAATALPYGLRDVKITPITAAGAYGTMVDLPNAQTFEFSEAEEFNELRGDDSLVAVRGQGAQVNWSLEAGGISLAAYAALVGGTVTESGVTPNVVRKYAKTKDDSRPYFLVEGQAISDSGGDFHAKVYKARTTDDIEGSLADGEFWVTSAGGQGLPDSTGRLYDLIQNETAAAPIQPA